MEYRKTLRNRRNNERRNKRSKIRTRKLQKPSNRRNSNPNRRRQTPCRNSSLRNPEQRISPNPFRKRPRTIPWNLQNHKQRNSAQTPWKSQMDKPRKRHGCHRTSRIKTQIPPRILHQSILHTAARHPCNTQLNKSEQPTYKTDETAV